MQKKSVRTVTKIFKLLDVDETGLMFFVIADRVFDPSKSDLNNLGVIFDRLVAALDEQIFG